MIICPKLLNRLDKTVNGNKIFIWYHPQKSRVPLTDVAKETTGI